MFAGAIRGPITAMPAPPQVYMDSSPATTPVTGRSIAVGAGGNLQAAIDEAKPGDEIVLAAGAVFRGNFVLRNKGRSTGVDHDSKLGDGTVAEVWDAGESEDGGDDGEDRCAEG